MKEVGETVLETVSLLPASESTPLATPMPSAAVTTEPSVTVTPTLKKTPRATQKPSETPKETPKSSETPKVTEIPAAARVKSYTIQPGDTLTSISQSVYGSAKQVDAICRLNGISKEAIIYPGEKILLP